MQLLLTFENTGIIDIPVNYNYLIQSAIFSLLAKENAEYAEQLHNIAYGGKNRYKFFTFGELIGKKHFHEKKLYYEGNIKLEIRSACDEFINVLTDAVSKTKYLSLGKHKLNVRDITKSDYHIPESLITIRTISPIIAKRQTEDNKSVFYSPKDVRFISRIRETFENKYEVFLGQKPYSSIDILPVNADRKVVTQYKNTWLTAYHGIFQLYGAPEYLQFLYNVGLGVKTSQGFGMFEVIDSQK